MAWQQVAHAWLGTRCAVRIASSVTVAAISGVAGKTVVRTGDKETGIKPIFDKHLSCSSRVGVLINSSRVFHNDQGDGWMAMATRV